MLRYSEGLQRAKPVRLISVLLLVGCQENQVSISNTAPEVAILTPAQNEVIPEGAEVVFSARVTEPETPLEELELTWSSPSGVLDGVSSWEEDVASLRVADGLGLGVQTITVQVIDGNGETGEDSITITIDPNEAPSAAFLSPLASVNYASGIPVDVQLQVSDVDTADLTKLSLVWGDAAAGNAAAPAQPDSVGIARFAMDTLTPGAYILSAVVTDPVGASSTATVALSVVDGDLDSDGHIDEAYGGDDCDDDDPLTYPGADERCDNIDNDCDGGTDENAIDMDTYYQDADQDGYGVTSTATDSCTAPTGFVIDPGDCDDGRSDVNPGADEKCDGIDNNCDTYIDDDSSIDLSTFYLDSDGDGYGDPASSTLSCDAPNNYVADKTDCDDNRFETNPGADEVCNGLDDDCSTVPDDNAIDESTWYLDDDDDGWGDSAITKVACDQPLYYVAQDQDCDDEDDTVHPFADELCDALDNDCDGDIDINGECPCEVENYQGNPYMFCVASVDWNTARSECYASGYHLVTIDDVSENDWVDLTVDSYSSATWWIGYNDVATEGSFVWEDGSLSTYSNWHSGEPNDLDNNEDCAELNYWTDGSWNDKTCSVTMNYVCEAEAL